MRTSESQHASAGTRSTQRYADWLRWSVIALAGGLAASTALGQEGWARYETQYYVIHSDLPWEAVREAAMRIDRVAEEYDLRTRAFAGVISRRLPFYLFSRAKDYYAAGGTPGSAGVFKGDKLMAVADQRFSARVWKVVQHEGFHQFVRAVIGGDIPVWVNEGLAEYFAEGVFVGDGFVTALISPDRLIRIRAMIKSKRYKPLPEMMTISHGDWSAELALTNYDQAFSMVYFLAHGESGVYEGLFNDFLRLISRGRAWEQAWVQSFGPGVEEFEPRWRAYWSGLPDNPTAVLYVRATVSTLTSFLARASSQKQEFDSATAFLEAASAGKLEAHPDDWLPPSLLSWALDQVEQAGRFRLERGRRKAPRLVCVMEDGTKLTGSFTLRAQRVAGVNVTVESK